MLVLGLNTLYVADNLSPNILSLKHATVLVVKLGKWLGLEETEKQLGISMQHGCLQNSFFKLFSSLDRGGY